MNNDEAMAALVAKRTSINTAINEMNRYIQESGAKRWSATVKDAQVAAIKVSATDGGVDLQTWDGTPAP